MKQRIVLCVFLHLVVLVKAQTWNVGIHTNNDKFYGQLWTTNHEINLLEFQSYDRYTMWIKYNQNGSLLWSKRICTDLLAYAPLSNNQLLVAHTNFDCDAGGNIQKFSSYDANGNLNFTALLTYSPTGIHVINDSTYWVFNTQILSVFQNSIASSINWTFTKIHCTINLSPDTVLVSASSNSVNCLFRFTENGMKIDSIITPSLIYDLDYLSYGNLLGSGDNGTLYKYTHQLNLISNSSSNPYKFYTHQITRNDTVIGIGNQNSSQAVVYMNSNFQILNSCLFSTPNHTLLSVCLNQNKLISVSNLYQGRSFQIGLKSSPIAGNLNFKNDAEITLNSIAIDSSFTFYPYKIYRFNANVTIKNNGPSFLSTVHIYKHAEYNFNCFQYIDFKEYTVSLAPGAQTTFSVSKYHFRFDPTMPTTNVEVCMYVSMPNNQSDSITVNNESCLSIPVSVLGLNDLNSNIALYPNPFNETLILEGDTPLHMVRVYSINGQLLFEFHPGEAVYKTNTDAWEKGMYLIEYETRLGRYHQKVIKD